ncbi:MAG: DUF418 domain-containing protein [Muribaculum sp.]
MSCLQFSHLEGGNCGLALDRPQAYDDVVFVVVNDVTALEGGAVAAPVGGREVGLHRGAVDEYVEARVARCLLGIALFFAQYLFCRWWMTRHSHGPFEYAWKRLTWI